MAFRNEPKLSHPEVPEGMKVQYKHQPLTIEHYGIHAKILENGKVIISRVADEQDSNAETIEYDEVEVPASLIFKLASLLKDTRTMTYVPIASAEVKRLSQLAGKDDKSDTPTK